MLSPKPPALQVTKPVLGPQKSGPLSPPGPSGTAGSPLSSGDRSASAAADVSVDETAAGGSFPLPAPRLKRALSEQEREGDSSGAKGLSPQGGRKVFLPQRLPVAIGRVQTVCGLLPADADALGSPGAAAPPDIGGRQWSSLKTPSSPPAVPPDDRERAKSLPLYGLTNHSTPPRSESQSPLSLYLYNEITNPSPRLTPCFLCSDASSRLRPPRGADSCRRARAGGHV